jgi:adenylate kinase family enzyme
MRRVSVVGGSCSGKTTLSRELAERLGVPHVELDALHHDPNWQEAPAELLQARVEAALAEAADGWVVDGNYHGKLGTLVLERADTVVWLDPPFPVALGRVLRRTGSRVVGRAELWNGNRETLRNALHPRESIVWWVMRTHRRYRRTIPERLATAPAVRVFRLRSAAEVRVFLDALPTPPSTASVSIGPRAEERPGF